MFMFIVLNLKCTKFDCVRLFFAKTFENCTD